MVPTPPPPHYGFSEPLLVKYCIFGLVFGPEILVSGTLLHTNLLMLHQNALKLCWRLVKIPLCMGLNSSVAKNLNMGCFDLFGGQTRKWPCIPVKPPNFLIQYFLSKSRINLLKEKIIKKYQTQLKIW